MSLVISELFKLGILNVHLSSFVVKFDYLKESNLRFVGFTLTVWITGIYMYNLDSCNLYLLKKL